MSPFSVRADPRPTSTSADSFSVSACESPPDMADAGKSRPEDILVADHIPAHVELLLDQLNSLGYETITAADGPSAVAASFEHQPDRCIRDAALPAGPLGG